MAGAAMGIRRTDAATLVGALATLCSTTGLVPQAWKVIRTLDTAPISRRMYSITVIGFSLWLTYGLLLSGFILTMKLLPRHQKEKLAEALDPAAG
ncbi:SemiSWEET family sugar transporter [Dankookia sp. P2]|uniref:SemiSWEET family sugar transporter n=1 Tax=Dankookia sp. P2 TaxID=3423955 RepID=UPI003D670C03